MYQIFMTTLIFRLFLVFSLLTPVVYACNKEAPRVAEENSLAQQIAVLVLEKTNAIRRGQGLPPLLASKAADELAQYHSDNMVTHQFFSHTDHQGTSPSDRADQMGVTWSAIAENIANIPWHENVSSCGDTRTAEALAECMVEGWRNSPGHYRNMIGDFAELGVGITFSKDSIVFGTQIFRTP